MDGGLVVSIVGVFLSLGMGVLLVLYPGGRLAWWLVLAGCVSVSVYFALRYFLGKLPADSDRIRQWFVAACTAFTALLCVAGMLYLDPSAYRAPVSTEKQAKKIKTGLKLQFFDDQRMPAMAASENIANWYAYFTPSVLVTQRDEHGNVTPVIGNAANWVIFVAFDDPAIYREVFVDFSNPSAMPIVDRHFMSTRTLVVSTRGQVPAGVLDIHVE
jgi:hypothetical protein